MGISPILLPTESFFAAAKSCDFQAIIMTFLIKHFIQCLWFIYIDYIYNRHAKLFSQPDNHDNFVCSYSYTGKNWFHPSYWKWTTNYRKRRLKFYTVYIHIEICTYLVFIYKSICYLKDQIDTYYNYVRYAITIARE